MPENNDGCVTGRFKHNEPNICSPPRSRRSIHVEHPCPDCGEQFFVKMELPKYGGFYTFHCKKCNKAFDITVT